MIHLLVDYYRNSRPERAAELDFCLLENINSKDFDHIHVFKYSELPAENLPDNVTIVDSKERNTYADYIVYAKENIPEGDTIVLSNSDIFFDNSIREVLKVDLSDKVLALTRFCPYHGHWIDQEGFITPYHNHDRSQDAWVWKNLLNVNLEDFKIPLGTLGCDNKIAYQFHINGYQVWNPSFSIIVYHKHKERNDIADQGSGRYWHFGPYLLPKACQIEHINTYNYNLYYRIE